MLLAGGAAGCGSSSGGSQAAGGDGGGDGGAGGCEPLDLAGAPIVTLTQGTGTAPAMTGGQVVPGDYVLMSATAYDPGGGMTDSAPERSVMSVGTSTTISDIQPEGDAGSSNAEIIVGTRYSVSGNVFDYSFTCNNPGVMPLPETYTATPTSITFSVHETPESPPGVGDYTVYAYTKR
jgi:hypothetical protein